MTSEDEVVDGQFRAVAVPEGGAEVEDSDTPSVLPGRASVAVAVLPVVAGGVIAAVPSGDACAVEAPGEGGALGDASGVAGGAEGDGLVADGGPGWLGSTRVAWPGSRDSPTLRPTTARTEPTALCAARFRQRTRTPARRRSRCFGSNGAGASVSRIICASCRSK
ncbi:hypothetical protein [Streptomyces sp. NBC_01363]|uniref:hypothetical protein n=1 Tax=Streptomyces sp. NBC_01363 TaxID=2903840 RepID=UPI002254D3DE|nr:hypothetical protein [Streptomyces sp. NBC_01363]MCX4734423.1 hypothetical protein [Streptomyces sp. NBC_01363]